MRAELKRMLRELGRRRRGREARKKLHHAGTLPSTVLADVTARDSDGDLIATPDEWDEDAHGPAPKIRIHAPRKARPGEAAGIGDRVLLHIEETERRRRHPPSRPRHQDHRSSQAARAGNFPQSAERRRPARAGRQENARQGTRHSGRRHRRRPGRRSGRGRDRPRAALGPARPAASSSGSARSPAKRAVSLIAIHAHSIPHVFRRDTLAEAEAARPATLTGREDWRAAAARHHRSARRQGSRRRRACRAGYSGNNHGGFIVTVAIADVAALRDARLGARPRSAGARQFGLFPRPRGADAAGAHFQRSVLAAPARGSRRARRAHGDRRRRPQALAHVPPHHDALGGEAVLPADAGRDRRAHRRRHRAAARSRC